MTINTDTIKANKNIIDLAAKATTLRKKSAVEQTGPCPLCGGDDRFNVQADKFLCRNCHPKWGDAIEYVQWVQGVSFIDACNQLEGNSVTPTKTMARPVSESKPTTQHWKASDWQAAAIAEMDAACDTLWNHDAGEPGCAYLAGRGLRQDVMIAFDLGYKPDAWNSTRQAALPAIAIPWKNRQITAIQYRFIGDDIQHGERFGMLKGSERLLFGAHLLAGHPTLILCEGEFNAMSIWQTCYGLTNVDVLSWGSQDGIKSPSVLALAQQIARKYERVIVWADEKDRANEAKKALGAQVALYSVSGRDANDLLMSDQLGLLIDQAVIGVNQ